MEDWIPVVPLSCPMIKSTLSFVPKRGPRVLRDAFGFSLRIGQLGFPPLACGPFDLSMLQKAECVVGPEKRKILFVWICHRAVCIREQGCRLQGRLELH